MQNPMNAKNRWDLKHICILNASILCSVIFMLFTIGPANGQGEAPRKITRIRVGSERDFPPYAFVDANGQQDGFSIDPIKAGKKAMGLSIQISTGLWLTAWKALLSDRVDVSPIMEKLHGREPLVDLSLPHTEIYKAFFVRKGEPALQNIETARELEIMVMRSDDAHQALPERNFQGKPVVDTIPAGLSLISSGRHNAFPGSKRIGTLLIKNRGITGLTVGAIISGFKRVFSFAARKGKTELPGKLNQGLSIIKTNAEYGRISNKWPSFGNPWQKLKKYSLSVIAVLVIVAVIVAFWLAILQRLVRKRTRELKETNEKLLHAYDDLETRIRERTAALTQSNQLLQTEIIGHKRAEEEIRSLARFPSENPAPVMRIDKDGMLLYANKSALNRLPQWRLQLNHSVPSVLNDAVSKALDIGSVESIDLEQGKRIYSFSIAPIPDAGYANIYGRDITETKQMENRLKENEKKYRELSITDDLTQLYNARYFHHQIQLELERADRYKQPLTLMLLDLDDFKQYNDTYGHIEGDHVLIRFGRVIKRCLRQTDSAYRYGGEEFTILLPMTTCRNGVVNAERIRTEFMKENFTPVQDRDIHITASIGLAQYRPKENAQIFVRRADRLMYQAKKQGKNRICTELLPQEQPGG